MNTIHKIYNSHVHVAEHLFPLLPPPLSLVPFSFLFCLPASPSLSPSPSVSLSLSPSLLPSCPKNENGDIIRGKIGGRVRRRTGVIVGELERGGDGRGMGAGIVGAGGTKVRGMIERGDHGKERKREERRGELAGIDLGCKIQEEEKER